LRKEQTYQWRNWSALDQRQAENLLLVRLHLEKWRQMGWDGFKESMAEEILGEDVPRQAA